MKKRCIHIALLFFIGSIVNGSLLVGQQFKLWGWQKQGSSFSGPRQDGNTVNLTSDAKIVGISQKADNYTVFRNGIEYVSVEKDQKLTGILPPGEYTLRTGIGSVTIYLDTSFQAEKITLWGRQHAVVKPLWDGNYVTLSAATAIVGSHYDGTDGMGIFRNGINRAYLLFISPHNLQNPGPKVIDMSGTNLGRSLVGLTLPAGVYKLVPGRGTGIGIVYGYIELNVGAAAGPPLVAMKVFSEVPKQSSAQFKSNRYNALRIATRSYDPIPYHMTNQFNGTVTVMENQRVILAGDAAGEKSWYVDNFLLFELESAEGKKRFVIGTVEPVTYDGVNVPYLKPGGFTFAPDSFDLADQFPKGVPVTVRISALDYGLYGGLSDVYLIVK